MGKGIRYTEEFKLGAVTQVADKRHSDINIFASGVILEQDCPFLGSVGMSENFGPGTNVLEAAYAVLADVEGMKSNR